MTSKMRKTIIVIMAAIAITLFTTIGLRVYRENYRKALVYSSSCNDHTVCIYMVGSPIFPYGETKCRIDLLKNGKIINEQSLSLLNDGSIVTYNNFKVEWNGEYVRVLANATEQDDIAIMLAL